MLYNGHENATMEMPLASDSRSDAEKDSLLQLYEAVLFTTPDLIYVFDLDHRFTFANNALLQMWGKTWDEARGKNCLELGYEPWHAEMHDREIDQVIATKQSIRGEVEFTGTNGRRTYDYIFSPVIGDDGKVKAISGTTRDISERKQAESDLKRAVEFDEAIMASMSEGLYTVDSQGSIVTMNPAAERLFGIKLNDVRGQNFHNIVHYLHPDGTPFPAEECETLKTLKKGKTITDNHEVFVRGDGTMFDAAYNSAPINIGNELTGSVVVFRDVTEDNRIAAELRATAARIRIAVEAARQVTWEWDLVDDLVYWNDGDSSVFGNTNAKSPTNSTEFFKVIHVEDLEAVRSLIEKAATERSVIDRDFRTIREDGTVRWISVYGQVTEWNNDRATRLSGVAADITGRKQTEETISHQKRLLEALTDSILDGILFVAPDGSILLHNQQFLEIWNFPQEVVESKSDEAALKWAAEQTADPAAFLARVGEIYGQPDGRFREEMPMKDGRVFERFGAPVQMAENRLGWVWTFRDISERKQAEQALRENESRLRTMVDSISQLAWMAEPDGFIFWYNRRWYEYTGTTPGQMEGWGWQVVHDPKVLPDVLKAWRNSIEKGVPFEMEFPLRGADGVFRWFLTRVNPVRDADGNIVRWFGTNTDIDESRRISEALRESEERRHLAQDAGKVGVWDWNIKAGKTYWSETMWKLYGEQQSEINPDETFWSARLHASDRERVKSNIQQVIESGENDFHDEFRIITNDGNIRWVDSKATVSRDATGEATRMYGVNLDITERKDTEERIRLSENQLRLVTNAVPALISYVDCNERYRFVNQQFHEWFGIPTEDLVGKKVRNVFGTPAYKVLKPFIDEALSGKQVAFETTIPYQAAGIRSVHISYMPDIGVDGTVYGYYGLTNDLTEFKRSQDLLRSSEERMALMVENVTDYAILSTDSEGRIDSWNIGAEIIFGYPSDEIIGRSCDILFTPEDTARGIPLKEMRTARLKGRASDERWQLRKDGTRFFADSVTMPLRVGDDLTGYAKIASDLTEKQRRAEELQRAHDQLDLRVKERTRELAESNLALVQEMEVREVAERQRIDLLGRLVTGQEVERRRIARDLHDQLGQRLTALRLNIASLKEFSAGNAGIESRVEHLQEIGEKLDAEVSFLAWELRPTALDDLGLVDAVGAFVNEWSRHYEIDADFHSSGLSKERLNHDTETHLYRITQEALNNIVKHADAKLVNVMLEKRDDSVTLIIEDDGCGFDTSDVRSSSESGLGLVGMSERSALVGGDLEIESSPGSGTTIFVRIPV